MAPAIITTDRPPAPREHGAWGILLVPFAVAVGVAGRWTLPVALLLVSVLCLYVARTSWLQRRWRWMTALVAASVAAGAPLVVVWKLWWLVAFGAVAAVLAAQPTSPSLWRQLLAVAGLTLTAPAAWYAATGALDYRLWLWNALYFAGGVFYVRMHLDAARKRPGCRQANLIYHAGLAVLLLALAGGGVVSWAVTWAFAPMLARAAAGSWRLSPVLRIKRLGWTEVAHSVLFGALLVLAMRQ